MAEADSMWLSVKSKQSTSRYYISSSLSDWLNNVKYNQPAKKKKKRVSQLFHLLKQLLRSHLLDTMPVTMMKYPTRAHGITLTKNVFSSSS